MTIYLVKTNGTVLAAYKHRLSAETHQRTVTGATLEAIELLDTLSETAFDDISVDEWNDEETPVQIMPEDITQTQPSTPRAKAKSKPPSGE